MPSVAGLFAIELRVTPPIKLMPTCATIAQSAAALDVPSRKELCVLSPRAARRAGAASR